MSRSLYSLDRESAKKLLTRNGLAKPMPSGPAAVTGEEEGFAQIKGGAAPAPLPAQTSFPSPQTGPDPRLVEQEEKWLQAQVRIKNLEEALAQVAVDNEKLSALKQQNAEMEGRNRLLEDQVESLGKKAEYVGTEAEELKARLVELDGLREQSEKNKAELDAMRLSLQGNEAQSAAELQDLRNRLEADGTEKKAILQAKEEIEAEKKTLAGKLIELDQELSAARAEIGKLGEELLKEKTKSAGAEAEAEQASKLRKQFETARNLLTQAADDNTRLEKERNEIKSRLQTEEEKKNILSAKIQVLEEEKQRLVSKAGETDQLVIQVRAEMGKMSVDFEEEKKRASLLQAEADQLPGLRKEIGSKSDLLDKAVESGAGLEKERDELLERIGVLSSEKQELSKAKEVAENDRTHFSGKLNEVGKELLLAREEITRLRDELNAEKTRERPESGKEELVQVRKELEEVRASSAKSGQEKQLLEKERDEWKVQVQALELELSKAKDALKQAVMAYHEVRAQALVK